MAKCPRNAFPRRSTVTRFSRNAFPGALPWQDFAAVRSRAAIRGNFFTPCIQKGPRTRKGGLRGKICAPCIQNELALARCARHVSEKPRKSPLEDTPREYLARKGPFSLHGPLESRTARRSCHRSAHERKGSGRKCLRFVKTEPKRQKMSPKVLTSF